MIVGVVESALTGVLTGVAALIVALATFVGSTRGAAKAKVVVSAADAHATENTAAIEGLSLVISNMAAEQHRLERDHAHCTARLAVLEQRIVGLDATITRLEATINAKQEGKP